MSAHPSDQLMAALARYDAKRTPGRTPARSVRVPDELWAAAKTRAGERGEDVSAVLVRALRDYVNAP